MATGSRGKSIDVTEGPIARQLLALCVPIFLASFFQQGYSLINTYIVGQFAGKAALGGIEATVCLSDFAIGFCSGLGAGCAVIVGQFFGAHDEERLARSIHTAMALSIVMGVVVAALGVLCVPALLRFMGTPADLMPEASAYARCYFGAMVFSLVLNMGVALLRAVGDTRTPAVIVASGCVFNIIFDIVFVAGLGLGALGCGIATALSLAINCACIVYRMVRADESWRLTLSGLRIDPALCRSMLSCGVPLAFQSAAYSVSNIITQTSINSFGVDAVTGWGLSGRIYSIVWMLAEALGVSVTTFSAQNFGAGNLARMRRGYHEGLAMSVGLSGVICVALFVFAEPLSRIFIADEGVVAFSVTMIRFVVPFYPVYAIVDATSGAIRGSGESFRPMVLTIFGTCILRIAWLLLVVPAFHRIEVLLLVYAVSWSITAVLFVLYHHFGRWLAHARERVERQEVAI